MDVRTIQNILNKFGFQAGPADGVMGGNTIGAVARFQTAYNVDRLAIDGQAGPATQAALAALDASGGRLSRNFTWKEMACRHCGLCFINRDLLGTLENLRAQTGRPVTVVSAYRCPKRNAQVGGAPNSMHVAGTAFDCVKGSFSMQELVRAGFNAIGRDGAGRPDHADIRPGGVISFYDAGSG